MWYVLLYGHKCWTMGNETEKKLGVVELWLTRRMLRIPRTEKKTNTEIQRSAGFTRPLIKTTRNLGGIVDGIEKQTLCVKIAISL